MTKFRAERSADEHARHDQPLIAAYAAGDVSADEARAARDQIESCRRCAALAGEIELVQVAVAGDVGVPRRPRDFRLSEADAVRLRTGPLTRLLRRLGGPGLSVLQPLAGAAVAIGLVLVVSTGALPRLGATAGAAPGPYSAAASDGRDNSVQEGSGATRQTAAPTPGDVTAFGPNATAGPATGGVVTPEQPTKSALVSEAFAPDPWLLVGLLLVGFGGAVLLLRLAARRVTEDRLLR
jgi:hypothetical protein